MFLAELENFWARNSPFFRQQFLDKPFMAFQAVERFLHGENYLMTEFTFFLTWLLEAECSLSWSNHCFQQGRICEKCSRMLLSAATWVDGRMPLREEAEQGGHSNYKAFCSQTRLKADSCKVSGEEAAFPSNSWRSWGAPRQHFRR